MLLPFRMFRRKQKVSIKEAFDNLPSGLCYFNANGTPVLCNRSMHRLAFALAGRDLQHISELETALAKPNEELGIQLKDGIYYLPDKSAWRFTSCVVEDEDGNTYTEYVTSDVTELCRARAELEKDNVKLREMTRQLKRLSANVAAVTREEETLALKMRVHDQMGRSLVTAHRILMQNQPAENINPTLKEWQSAIDLLRQAGSEPEKTDALADLTRISGDMIKIITTGSLPEQDDLSYLIVSAIRECVTNALRYAGATELYAALSCEDGYMRAVITNNGTPPTGPITEGGGLSSLRRHIERNGGSMEVTSIPAFELKVTVPVGKGEIIDD